MKARFLILATMLAVITLGGSVFLALSQGEEVKAKVAWNPKRYTLDTAVPDPWNAEIWLTKGHKREEINTTTILLEGIYKPSADPYPAERGPRLIVPFSGEEVLTALLTKLPHMTSGRHRIPLEITGLLLDGTPFRGVGYIKLTVP